MKQLASDYESGKWSPFSEVGGKIGVDPPEVEDSGDSRSRTITASKETNRQRKRVKKPSTKKGKYMYVELYIYMYGGFPII